MIVNSPDGLSVKQRLFVDYYIQLNGNLTQAALKAGYSPKTAYAAGAENLKKPQIQAALASRTAQLENERTATTQEVLEYPASVMRGEAVEEVVVNVGTGIFSSFSYTLRRVDDRFGASIKNSCLTRKKFFGRK